MEGVTRDGFDAATEDGSLVLAHVIRGAIHALAPADHGLFGPALVGCDDKEVRAQIGYPLADLEQVTAAVRDALAGGPLTRDELHEQLRARVREELLPWCEVCRSHHVAGNLWRGAVRRAGGRLDSQRRHLLSPLAEADPADAVRRFLHFYGPATRQEFAEWAGVTGTHAKRIWPDDLDEVPGQGWLAPGDAADLESPPAARGVRLLPPGDPFLQKPNRALLAPDSELRRRMFRAVGSPGAVLVDGRLAGAWRVKGRTLTVEALGRLRRGDLEEETARVAAARGTGDLEVVLA